MVLIVLLTIPIGGSTSFHITLFFRGKTPNKQVTGKFKSNINTFDCEYLFNCSKISATSRPPNVIVETLGDIKMRNFSLILILNC
ncbi:unnamed protein product [Rotaria magnacalcarata]